MNKAIFLALMVLVPSVASAQDAGKFIGTWVNYGKPFLIVTQEGNFIRMAIPQNPDLMAEFQNIRIEDGKLKFEQIYFLVQAPEHPFNGVVNYCEMWEDAEGNMLFKTWIDEKQATLPPEKLTRYNPEP